jgi:hypothetical protein
MTGRKEILDKCDYQVAVPGSVTPKKMGEQVRVRLHEARHWCLQGGDCHRAVALSGHHPGWLGQIQRSNLSLCLVEQLQVIRTSINMLHHTITMIYTCAA